MKPLVVALVGAGPKGLYALERLSVALEGAPPNSVEVVVFEPHPAPGAGPHYDVRQPEYLRMNFPNRLIDAWVPDDSTEGHLSFCEWSDRRGLPADSDGFAPRATVGRYLADCFDIVSTELGAHADVRIVPERVLRIEPSGDRWVLHGERKDVVADEVLIATGHSLRSNAPDAAAVASVFPLSDPMGVRSVADGAAVAIRGFGLTCIDASLALTEGRGGEFRAASGGVEYVPPAAPGVRIVPFSRTGRPMTPKPDPSRVPTPDVGNATRVISRDLSAGSGSVTAADVTRAVSELATAALVATSERDPADSDVEAGLRRMLDDAPLSPVETVGQMRSDLRWATGQTGVGAVWAVGHAWRLLYPTLVEVVAQRRLDADWQSFAELGRAMERVAFGPPVRNAQRMLALVDAGVLDLRLVSGAEVERRGHVRRLRCGAEVLEVDTVIDAVLPHPGYVRGRSDLLDDLVDAGHITLRNEGVDVTADGRCVGVGGLPTPGLAAIGRPTEGSTLGNDTLSRTLHDHPERWAATVAARVTGRLSTAARVGARQP